MDCKGGHYQFDWVAVCRKNGKKYRYHGTAYGRVVCDESEAREKNDYCYTYAEITDMTVEVYKEE